ncbi:CD209 antigen-like protein 2 [Plectropomus leopardus]|uniref:CD209 antigen-like protein 2 n=1 Tax=Plectropomus leopardus TaxID=160734 RepID=UPI001C4BDE6A|nr:CD209 antigen-like protein 2 [Plectropomus leopardus]
MISNDDCSTDGKSSHTGNSVRVGSRSLPLHQLVIGCLGLLNTILMLTAVVIGIYCGTVREEASPQQITAQALFAEVKQLQIMQTEVTKAQEEAQQALEKELRSHHQLKLQLEKNKTVSDSFQQQLEKLHVEKATLKSSTSDIRESCGRCQSGWLLFNTSCYFHSIAASNPLKNWHDSRADCIRRGADLAVIDSLEEQINLFEYLPKLDKSIRPWWSKPGGIWFGLSDIHTERTWVWINNVTLHDGGYWIQGEPNNYGQAGEDCAAIMNINNPRETWFDANCQGKKQWLCEMAPN